MTRTAFLTIALSAVVRVAAAQSLDSMGTMEMSGTVMASAHMEMTPVRAPQPGDSARAAGLLDEMRRTLARYRDVDSATADGYRRFLPRVKHQPVFHYTNWMNALEARSRFDATKPTALLYQEDGAGRLVLVGAMYSAPAGASFEDLDRRIPLGIARWHRHVNWCLPPVGARERWTEVRNGAPVFGPKSPIATREACDAVGGRFQPRIFGWMVHVNAFASDPGDIWGEPQHPKSGK